MCEREWRRKGRLREPLEGGRSHTRSFVPSIFDERHNAFRGGLESHWNALSLLTGPGSEHTKMQVWSARKTSVARVGDGFPRNNPLPGFDQAAALLQMAIVAERPIIMAD